MGFCLEFGFELNRKLEELAMENGLTENRTLRPVADPSDEAVTMRDEFGDTKTLIRVREDGTVHAATALLASPLEPKEASRPGGVAERLGLRAVLDFAEISAFLVGAARFAAAVCVLGRPGRGLETASGFSNCQGHGVILRAPGSPSRSGGLPMDEGYQQPVMRSIALSLGGDGGEFPEGELLRLLKAASRLLGTSTPEGVLAHYL